MRRITGLELLDAREGTSLAAQKGDRVIYMSDATSPPSLPSE